MSDKGTSSRSNPRAPQKRGTNNGASMYLNLPFGAEQEVEYEAWLAAGKNRTVASCIKTLISDGLGVKFGAYDDSYFVTLDSREAREAGNACLLSGWSDSVEDSLFLAMWKFKEQLSGQFAHPTSGTPKSRRR